MSWYSVRVSSIAAAHVPSPACLHGFKYTSNVSCKTLQVQRHRYINIEKQT